MPKNPPEGYPRISPYLYYEDAGAMIDWLTQAFGFTERLRVPGEGGRVMHAEIEGMIEGAGLSDLSPASLTNLGVLKRRAGAILKGGAFLATILALFNGAVYMLPNSPLKSVCR